MVAQERIEPSEFAYETNVDASQLRDMYIIFLQYVGTEGIEPSSTARRAAILPVN